MQLLIIRHADAGDAEEWARTGKPDSERPLSDKGRRQFKRAASAIVRLVPKVELVASSPFARAMQTTDLLFEQLPKATARKVTDSLVPDADPEEFIRWLGAQAPRGVIAAVGHEPHLSTLATCLIAGLDESRLVLKKGGACLIAFDEKPDRNTGMLQWLARPKLLKIAE
jgi:phosphohistidine phosphatase